MSKLKAAEQMHQVASDERQEEMQMRSALEQQISQVWYFLDLLFRCYNFLKFAVKEILPKVYKSYIVLPPKILCSPISKILAWLHFS